MNIKADVAAARPWLANYPEQVLHSLPESYNTTIDAVIREASSQYSDRLAGECLG